MYQYGRQRAYSPQADADEAFEFSDPVQQNRTIINANRNQRTSNPVLPEWADYRAVLAGRGAQMNPNARPAGPAAPAGVVPGSNQNYLRASIEALLRGQR